MSDPVRDRSEGRARTGSVNLRSFDEGMVETLGATITDQNYYLTIPEVDLDEERGAVAPPPGSVGIPVVFSFPEDALERYKLPMILLRREDLNPAMQRWHPGLLQYRGPARGAVPVQYQANSAAEVLKGWDKMEQRDQAVPFDFTFTIQVVGRSRGSSGAINRALDHILRIYPPYGRVLVKDSLGDLRSYDAYMEGVSPVDDVAEIADRVVGFAVTVRVEGELDLNDPVTRKTVTSALSRAMTQRR